MPTVHSAATTEPYTELPFTESDLSSGMTAEREVAHLAIRHRPIAHWIQQIQARLRPQAVEQGKELPLDHPVGVDEVAIGLPPSRPRPTRSRTALRTRPSLPGRHGAPSEGSALKALWAILLGWSSKLTNRDPSPAGVQEGGDLTTAEDSWFTGPISQEDPPRRWWGWGKKGLPRRAPDDTDIIETEDLITRDQPSVSAPLTWEEPETPICLEPTVARRPKIKVPDAPRARPPFPRATRSGGPARPLDTPATFAVDAAHNGFTMEEAYALFLEKRMMQGVRIRARIAPPRAKGDWTPDHWNEEWNQAWAIMEEWKERLAAVRTPEAWEAYMANAPRDSLMYQRWVPMAEPDEEESATMAMRGQDAAHRLPEGDIPSWATLAKLVKSDQDYIFWKESSPAPGRWDHATADRLLARWMRRVGIQVLQWPWSAPNTAQLKWEMLLQLRQIQRGLVSFTGWRGPVLGIGGPLWMRLGIEVSMDWVRGGGVAHYHLGVPTLSAYGIGWADVVYHEWFHCLEGILAQTAPPKSDISRASGMGLMPLVVLLSNEDNKQHQHALPRSRQAIQKLLANLKAQAPKQAPEDWVRVRSHYVSSEKLEQFAEASEHERVWCHRNGGRQAEASYRFWENPKNWPTPTTFKTIARQDPYNNRLAMDMVEEAQRLYRWQVALAPVAPGWFQRMAGHLDAGRAWDHQPKEGFAKDWWEDPAEHLAMAFEEGVFHHQGRPRFKRPLGGGHVVLCLTPLECEAIQPAWETFFRTLDPVWRRIRNVRERTWHHHPFPMREGSEGLKSPIPEDTLEA